MAETSHLTDLRLAAASRGHLSLYRHPVPPPTTTPFFCHCPFFSPSFCSSSSSAQRRITKGVVGGRQKSEHARQRVGWRGAFISGSLHFAWRSPERRRQSETSIRLLFFFSSPGLRRRSCGMIGRRGKGGGSGGGAFTGVFGYTTGENDMGMFSVLL